MIKMIELQLDFGQHLPHTNSYISKGNDYISDVSSTVLTGLVQLSFYVGSVV